MSVFKVIQVFDGIQSYIIQSPDEVLVADANDFLKYLATCSRSVYTLKSYARGLADFLDWLQQRCIPLAAVNQHHIDDYIGEFARSTKRGACLPNPKRVGHVHPKTRKSYPGLQRKSTTINHRLSVLTSLFAFCIRRDTLNGQGEWQNRANPVAPFTGQAIHHNMTGRDQSPRRRKSQLRRHTPRHLPGHISPELAEQMIEQAGSWRDRAVLTLLLRTGQRIGEWSEISGHHGILGMTTADVDEMSGTITVRLKASRDEHRVPVTEDFWPLYHQYLEHERPTDTGSQALWITSRRGQRGPLSYATFESALRYIGRKLGVNVNAHMFRHMLAQGILETTGNLKVAQEILGHAHVSTTADQYMYVDEVAMVKALTSVKRAFDATGDEFSGTLPSRYAFPYDAITIEELEKISGHEAAPRIGERIDDAGTSSDTLA